MILPILGRRCQEVMLSSRQMSAGVVKYLTGLNSDVFTKVKYQNNNDCPTKKTLRILNDSEYRAG
jgi:hypothetical protein